MWPLQNVSSLDLSLLLRLLGVMTFNFLAQLSVKQLKRAIAIRQKIETLQAQLSKLVGAETSMTTPRKRRKLSAAAKAKISAAAKKRWAKFRASKGK